MRACYVYILANASRSLYVGVTGSLERRLHEHKQKLLPGFTREYNLSKLVYFEVWGNARSAISREKQIKGWRRTKKVALIESANAHWRDLSAELFPKTVHRTQQPKKRGLSS